LVDAINEDQGAGSDHATGVSAMLRSPCVMLAVVTAVSQSGAIDTRGKCEFDRFDPL
jgi:hypothetical protein